VYGVCGVCEWCVCMECAVLGLAVFVLGSFAMWQFEVVALWPSMRVGVCIWIADSLCCTAETDTTL